MNKTSKKICLITPNHICTNPRLVKEATALEKAGFAVHLIFSQSDEFETKLDHAILAQHPRWTFDAIDWGGKSLRSSFYRIYFGFLKKLAESAFSFFRVKIFAPFIVNRNFPWQLKKALSTKADLYIGHNLGALPIARIAAARLHKKFGFDAEDFHRHETSDDPSVKDVVIKSFIEEQNFKGIDHCTAASPLIASAYQILFPSLSPAVVLNVFPRTDVPINETSSHIKLRLFWFSQTLGDNRGIENIISAMSLTKKAKCELHLLGKPIAGYKTKIEELALTLKLENQLFFYDPVPEKKIFGLASSFDIGMASETGIPHNRNICLTNKIFTYIQSGLAVLASDTEAQTQFFQQYSSIGKIYQKNNPSSLAVLLDYYAAHREELELCKLNNYNLGQISLNWEMEQRIFLRSVRRVLHLQKEEVLS